METIHDIQLKTAQGKLLSDCEFINLCKEYNNFLGGELVMNKDCQDKAMILAHMACEIDIDVPNVYKMGFTLKFE